MAWFKVDDNFYDHPKVDSLTLEAVGVWLLCGTYAARHLTDGHIATRRAYRMGATEDTISELVEAGLWVETPGGYQFHEWDLYQPTRASVEEERAKARERQQKWRRSRNALGKYVSESEDAGRPVTAMSRRDTSVTNAVTSGEVTAKSRRSHTVCHASPDPTRPDPTRPLKHTPAPTAPNDTKPTKKTAPKHFNEFWNHYPRKVGKRAAETAYRNATKRADESTIIDGVKRYATDPNLPDPKFIPHPATWLNRDGWLDEPEPTQPTGTDAHRFMSMTERKLHTTMQAGLAWAAEEQPSLNDTTPLHLTYEDPQP